MQGPCPAVCGRDWGLSHMRAGRVLIPWDRRLICTSVPKSPLDLNNLPSSFPS